MSSKYNPATGQIEPTDEPDRGSSQSGNWDYYATDKTSATYGAEPPDEPQSDEQKPGHNPEPEYENFTGREQRIRIDGELLTIDRVYDGGYLPLVETSDGCEYYLVEDAAHAGKKARKYWEEMAEDDPKELACIVGEETLVQWGLGQFAGPGYTHVRSLDEWLDLWLDVPEEQWGSYDGNELDVDRYGTIADDIGFVPTVAYRHN